MEQVGRSDTDDFVREIDEEVATWNQLLRSSSDWPRSPNNEGDQIREGQAGATETGSIRVLD